MNPSHSSRISAPLSESVLLFVSVTTRGTDGPSPCHLRDGGH